MAEVPHFLIVSLEKARKIHIDAFVKQTRIKLPFYILLCSSVCLSVRSEVIYIYICTSLSASFEETFFTLPIV